MITAAELIEAGKTGKTHGVQGEVACDFECELDWNQCCYLVFDMDGIFVPFFIESVRNKNAATKLLKFADIDDEPTARRLCNKTIYVKKELVADNDRLSLDYFVGFTIIDRYAGQIGTISAVDDSTANALFAVDEQLIPVCEEFIENIDHDKKILYMNLPEGLLSV